MVAIGTSSALECDKFLVCRAIDVVVVFNLFFCVVYSISRRVARLLLFVAGLASTTWTRPVGRVEEAKNFKKYFSSFLCDFSADRRGQDSLLDRDAEPIINSLDYESLSGHPCEDHELPSRCARACRWSERMWHLRNSLVCCRHLITFFSSSPSLLVLLHSTFFVVCLFRFDSASKDLKLSLRQTTGEARQKCITFFLF